MARFLRAAIFLALVFSAQSVFAACRVVTPSGSGSRNGADWSNAYAGLPGTLVRGDIYYLADGNYSSYTFTTADSGTTTIQVRKAQTYDHCTDAGWNAGAMGSGQAIFPEFNISSGSSVGYVTFTGNGQSAGMGCGSAPTVGAVASDCGIKVNNCGTLCIGINPDGGTNNTHNITLAYIELEGFGRSYNEQNVFRCRETCNDVVLDHIYAYEAGCTFFKVTNANGFTVKNSYFRKNYDNTTCHGQMWISEGTTSNVTFAGNYIADIDGTGVWVGVTGAKGNNWYIYNNVITRTPGNGSGNGISNGLIDWINSGSQGTNVNFIGNTIVNVTRGNTTGFNWENGGGSLTVRNNLWYASDAVTWFGNGNPSVTQSNNSCLNMGCNALSNGNANVKVSSGSPNPFVNASGQDFHLASEHANWTNWLPLGAPYNLDADGSIRSTDRGAFQFGQSQTQAPQPPTGLVVTVQ